MCGGHPIQDTLPHTRIRACGFELKLGHAVLSRRFLYQIVLLYILNIPVYLDHVGQLMFVLKWSTKTVRDKRCKLKVIYLNKFLSNCNVNTIKISGFFQSF